MSQVAHPLSIQQFTLRFQLQVLLRFYVSALSEARFHRSVGGSAVLWRAFDKAVRRKPPVVAADAGPMQIQLWEGAVSRCTGAVR